MGERNHRGSFQTNVQRFLSTLEMIITKYSEPNEDDLVINLEDMTFDSPSGPKPWCPTEIFRGRKTTENSLIEKFAEVCESESSRQSDLTCSVLSGEADQTLDVDILKDEQCGRQRSKVEHLAKTESQKPLLIFTPQSKNINSRQISLDCSDFQETFSGDFGCCSPKFKDNNKEDPSSDLSISSSQLFENSTTFVSDSKELDSLKFAKIRIDLNRSDAGKGVSASIDASIDHSFIDVDVSSSLSDSTLVDIYPGMLVSMSNLLERSYKTHAATRLVKHYRRLQMNVSKSRRNTTQDRVNRKTKIVPPQLKKRMTQGTLLEWKENTDSKLADRKVYSLTKYKPQDNLEQRFSAGVTGDFRTKLQASNIGSLSFRNLYNEAGCSPTIQLTSYHSCSPLSIINGCYSSKTEVSNAASPNGSTLHKLNTPPEQRLRKNKRLIKLRSSPNLYRLNSRKALSNVALAEFPCSMPVNSQSDVAVAQSPCSTFEVNLLLNAESSAPVNNSPLAKFSPSKTVEN
ncbi:uncharacterized protein LOC103180198 [Callorhinchus milii]|uniref:uncharacterized protein LOC103180198 n=1 Tax=Callorhinchus milii TaxID=7868 RepID=UPI001C3F806F|nr:uncharacterized protein LOC103180198 [Callorhinchus milii]